MVTLLGFPNSMSKRIVIFMKAELAETDGVADVRVWLQRQSVFSE